ncbi:MAG: serine/threonine-protein kinase, partial [bacterium]
MALTPLPPGARVADRFVVEREAAAGATAVVYAGWEEATGRRVAIKVFSVEGAGRALALARFEREALLGMTIEGPDLCPVLAQGALASGPALVQPWVEGPSLASCELPWSFRRATALIARLLRALAALHAQGVAHRDLKPANVILVDAGGGDEHLCLVDFGLATPLDQAPDAKLTATGAFAGTPRYMAPEQVLGERAGAATDVYQAALVLVELLQGRPAVAGDSAYACMQAHVDGTLDVDAALRAGPLGSWLAATLARAPDARPT